VSKYKDIVDMLASLASLIAIISVLISWYRNSRKPLKVEKVIIRRKDSESRYILIIKNKKDYPVEIKSAECYTNKKYEILKKMGQKPEYSEMLSHSERLFSDSQKFKIEANGHTDISIIGRNINNNITKLLFSLHTSHGYHELWCSNILIVPVEQIQIFDVEYHYKFETKFKARIKYYWVQLKDFFT
jgi:hypothetical protein